MSSILVGTKFFRISGLAAGVSQLMMRGRLKAHTTKLLHEARGDDVLLKKKNEGPLWGDVHIAPDVLLIQH